MKALKNKIDVYFDLDGDTESQLWYYGTISIVGICFISVILGGFIR